MQTIDLTTGVDAFTRQNRPDANFGSERELKLNGGAGSDDGIIYIYFRRPFGLGATIFSAKLYFTLCGDWDGTNGLSAYRVTQSWAESRITWNRTPGTEASPDGTASVVAGSNGQEISIDVASIMEDAAAGGAYYGIKITLTQNVLRKVYGLEANVASRRPHLEISWGKNPYPPSRCEPSGGKAVSIAEPTFKWQFVDNAGDTTQAYSQVQIDDATTFASPVYDTGQVANTKSVWDTSTVGAVQDWSGISAGQTRYWRVRVWDGAGLVSDWSDTVSFTRTAQPTLTIVNPPAPPSNTVEETTPPLDWTNSGTQEAAEVHLWRLDSSGKVKELLKRWVDLEDETVVTVPKNLIRSGKSYRMRVRSWDDVHRATTPGDPQYLEAQREFTYVRSGAPDAVATLSYTVDGPKVTFTWTRTQQPDYFCLRVDDEEVLQRIDTQETFVSGSTYTMDYWGLRPGHTSTCEIEAVVNDTGKLKHSDGNPTVSVTTDTTGAYLVNLDDNSYVEFKGGDEPDLTIGEAATTFYPIGSRSPVRITDNVRGYEGTISGLVFGRSQRNTLLDMKEEFDEVRLIIGDLNIPVTLEEVSISPAHLPGGDTWNVSVSLFQSSEFSDVITWRA